MSRWTPDQMPPQDGRRVVVTGGNSGIGLQAALELARHGASVVLAVRDPDGRGRAAASRILAASPGASVEVRRLDLADLSSVRAFAEEWGGEPLDLLVNNAGVMALPRRETADGFEMQFGTNHLGHFAMTGLLLPALLRTARPRVVTVSSGLHKSGRMAWDDLQGERSYRRWKAYGQSKLANLLFMYELQRRADAAGQQLRSMAAHPGYAATNLQVRGPQMDRSGVMERLMGLGNAIFAQSDAAGAWPTLFAATEDVPPASYVGPGGLGEMRGHPHLVTATTQARSPEDGARLWEASEELTGVEYAWSAGARARP
jgi:NAD(P)-dependent dehydrogenase (short-subunit alcohol dehydrogenase family)